MAWFARNILLLCLLAFSVTACDALARVRVLITNEMSEYQGRPNVTITLHCRSRDDDLGVHQIPYLEKYEFSFHPSVVKNTVFECGVKWDGDCHSFVAYNKNRDRHKCRVCLWKIKPEAACMYNYGTKTYDCPEWGDWCQSSKVKCIA
ncbi:putative plant self-incompatibility S1 [Rosa chinensis]|uniref:S-protein homolog n=1 Tax=Rosa chinensis TaxID=74649 RepID=A0A2P6QRV3_ROSCH|nr:putative plant self-incompatibility S1 [Rosa chinensis]